MADNFQAMAAAAARQANVPTDVFQNLVKVESGGHPGIVSSVGAVGLSGLMPGIARGLGVDPFVPKENLKGGATYLRSLYDKFESWPSAVSAYNAGAALVEQHGGVVPGTEDYVSQVLKGTQHMLPTGLTPGVENVAGGIGTGPLPKGTPGIAAAAARYVGTPYVWGGESPRGFDCSGLLQYAAAQVGIHIGRTTYQQWDEGTSVDVAHLRPGDAVFFQGADSIGGLPGHVGIYIGHGEFIEAPHTGASVRIAKLAGYPGYMGARRY